MNRYLLGVAAVILSVALSGCATNIMKSYVGQSVQEVMVDYGPPTFAFDMDDGTRAFQWVIGHTYRTPMRISGTAWTTGPDDESFRITNATVSGGATFSSDCIYTMYGRWDADAKRWKIASFEKPRFICE